MLPIGGTGPQPIPKGHGRSVLAQEEPYRTVNLDAGTFDWLWRMVESKAELHYQDKWLNEKIPEQVQVALKAAIAFREAAGTMDVPVEQVEQVEHKRKIRKKALAKTSKV